jgi:AraC-like DNA-binding protein
VQLLQFFANQLGPLANQILLREQSAEPEQITRARKFIEDQHREKLTLSLVARQAGMSTFHFCKKFKQATGVHFTHYVSCVRVEEAKKLFLNSNYRVCEVAYGVGFQSLTHFNRAFRTIAGESPRQYRQRMSNI